MKCVVHLDRWLGRLALLSPDKLRSGFHFFFKSKEIIVLFWYVACGFTYLVWVFVLRIKKFYNFETTTIYIKMNVPLIVIWGMRLPNSCFRMQFFNRFPYLKSVSSILCAWFYIQKMKWVVAGLIIYNNDCSADSFSANFRNICFSTFCVKRFFYIFRRKNFFSNFPNSDT